MHPALKAVATNILLNSLGFMFLEVVKYLLVMFLLSNPITSCNHIFIIYFVD